MYKIFSPPDYKKIISQIFQDWEKLNLPKADKSKVEVKILPFRKVGRHSLLNFMLCCKNELLLVIKMPRYKEGELAFAALENEEQMLKYLEQKKIFADHIPQVYKLLHTEKVPVLLLKAYQGKMLHHYLDQEEDPSKLDGLIANGAELLLRMESEQKNC